MESSIIEFCGELSEKYKRNHLIKTAKTLWVIVAIIFFMLCIPIIIVGINFNLIVYALILISFIFFVCLTAPIAIMKSISFDKTFPIKVIIENGEIAAINLVQASKLNSHSDGISSLNIDGYFITDIKPISEVKKVVDYGEWYGIYFNSRHVFTDYICQKSLISKGSIEDFERLFEDKIKVKRLRG